MAIADHLNELRIEILAVATQIAMHNAQVVGPKNDYYVTLEQLEMLFRGIRKED